MRRAARLLLYAGVALAVLGLGRVHAAAIGHYDYSGSSRFAWSLGYIGLLCACAYGVGLPDLVRSLRQAAVAGVAAGSAAAAGVSLAQLLVGSALLPRFVVLAAAAWLMPWAAVCALVVAGGRSRAEEHDRVEVVAPLGEAVELETELARRPEKHAKVVATLSPAEAIPQGITGQPLVERLLAQRASVVVLSRAAQDDERIVAQAAALHEAGVRVRTLSLFYEEWLGKLPVPELERVSLMFDIGELHRARYGRVKRLFDVALALAGTVLLIAVTPLVVLGNLVANRGALLYRQPRVGRNGKTFHILKFRTMRADNKWVSEWTSEADPRVTPFGRILRRTHLDELPQVLNILRGDLSVVGPRPEQPHYVAQLARKLPFYDLRHLVRPGLTGWAQVKFPYGASDADALEKLQYELYYLRHQGLRMDAAVVGRSLRSVVGLEGR